MEWNKNKLMCQSKLEIVFSLMNVHKFSLGCEVQINEKLIMFIHKICYNNKYEFFSLPSSEI